MAKHREYASAPRFDGRKAVRDNFHKWTISINHYVGLLPQYVARFRFDLMRLGTREIGVTVPNCHTLGASQLSRV